MHSVTIPEGAPALLSDATMLAEVDRALTTARFPDAFWTRLARWAGHRMVAAEKLPGDERFSLRVMLQRLFLALETCSEAGRVDSSARNGLGSILSDLSRILETVPQTR